MALTTYIGAVIGCVAATPATVDSTGFAALTYTTIGRITEFGEIGDSAEDATETTLAGRTTHVNGALDGGTAAFTVLIDGSDAGQTILRTNNNTNTTVSFKITDPDGKISYFYGLVANIKDRARSSNTIKGVSGEVRINSAVVLV